MIKQQKIGKTCLTIQECNKRRYKYCVVLRRGGTKQERYFLDKASALEHYRKVSADVSAVGVASLDLTNGERVLLADAKRQLQAHGATLADAVSHYLAHLQTASRSISIAKLADSLVTAKEAEGKSKEYVRAIECTLKLFLPCFGERIASTVTTADISKWLQGQTGVTGTTVLGYKRHLSVLFSYGEAQGTVAKNPVSNAFTPKVTESETEVLPPAEFRKLLATAPDSLIARIAIPMFTGIRDAELCRLTWQDVDLDRGTILISAKNSKTAQRRVIDITPVLRSWLEPLKRNNPLVPTHRRHFAAHRAGVDWPKNAFRHSFASYHLERFRDAPALALILGHTGTALIFRHYRALVTKAAAEEYFSLTRDAVIHK